MNTSEVIALVDKPADFAEQHRAEPSGCEATRWPLKVAKVLKQGDRPPGREPIREGASISVVVNTIGLADCTIRRLDPWMSVSFAASSYSPGWALLQQPERFIVFLRINDERIEVAAMNAFEAASKQGEIEALIAGLKDTR